MSSLEEMLRKVKKQRWENHQQIVEERNTCNYNEGSGCSLCRNKNKCILDEVLWQDVWELKYLRRRKDELKEIIRISEYEKEAITGGTHDDKQLRKWLYNNYGVCDSWLDIVPKVKQELSELSLAEEKLVRKINRGKNNMKKWRVTN